MPIKLNSAGGGSVTLDVPSTASTYTHTLPARTGTIITSADSQTITSGMIGYAGAPLQVVQATKTSAQYITGARVWQDVTGLSATITPSSSTNKILIMVTLQSSGDGSYDTVFKLQRNGSDIALADAWGSRIRGTFHCGARQLYEATTNGINFLDSPASTSALTYKVQCNPQDGTMINADKYANSNDNGSAELGISTIILMEIKA